jgi:hypothetical protein
MVKVTPASNSEARKQVESLRLARDIGEYGRHVHQASVDNAKTLSNLRVLAKQKSRNWLGALSPNLDRRFQRLKGASVAGSGRA